MIYGLEDVHRWLEHWRSAAEPKAEEFASLRHWLDGLSADPRQTPLAESVRGHPHLLDELRTAFLLSSGGTFVVYAVDDAQHIVRMLYIGGEPREGVTFRLPV